MNMQIDLEKGIANVGDVSRMKEVMARAKRGGASGNRFYRRFDHARKPFLDTADVLRLSCVYMVERDLSAGGVCLLQCWNRRHDIGVRRGACGDGSSGGETGLCDCGIFRQ